MAGIGRTLELAWSGVTLALAVLGWLTVLGVYLALILGMFALVLGLA